ncbi:ATP-binding protein [Neisseriaceae bacterium CLB008]
MTNKIKSRHAPPQASAMIEALRGMGYNTETALADIIDNSISANAKNIEIFFEWDGKNSRIVVKDDGFGMNAEAIDIAMRLGGRNPLETRGENDLGRFGLGLKTASFSQCRRLTVISSKDDSVNSLRWDLDVLRNQTDGFWHLLEGPFPEFHKLTQDLRGLGYGTIVIWDELDRIISDQFTIDDWLALLDRVEAHLSMVFHRYLDQSNALFTIKINNRDVKAWDPFLLNHPSKPWNSPTQSFNETKIKIECHVLPHKDHLTAKEFDLLEGPNGWVAQQGFYIYRNKRLLVAGSWLGLKSHRLGGKYWVKDEMHKFARIKLDIPNSMDQEWGIDIRKATARPPVYLRPWLARHAEDTRKRARRVFVSRGQVTKSASEKMEIKQAWRVEHSNSGIRYKIDLSHPIIYSVLKKAEEFRTDLNMMLKIIEETVPVQRIWLDTAENTEIPLTSFSGESSEAVFEVISLAYKNMIEIKGMTSREAKFSLQCTEPFNNYPNLIAMLDD